MEQKVSNRKLDKLPPKKSLIETLKILKADSKASRALGELKGIG